MKTLLVLLIGMAFLHAEEFYDYEPWEEEVELPQMCPPLEDPTPTLVDLEEMSQDFVLETKRIDIPGYVNAFNPSIIRWKGSLLLSFRTYHPVSRATNLIGLTWLTDDFELKGTPQIVETKQDDPFCLPKKQDPRLIAIGDRLFMVYNSQLNYITAREIRRMVIAELHQDGERFYTDGSVCLDKFEGANEYRSQKNWVPFDYRGELQLAYSISPHLVYKPLDTGECEMGSMSEKAVPWDWGVLRGGTPALKEGDEYLAFFHSSINLPSIHSNGKTILHYFMGAYTFSPDPPFEITRISPAPIVGKNFYHGIAYKTWKPLRVVFPGGFVSDEKYIWVVYGRQDHEVWAVKLDKKKLFESLIPVE